MKQLLLIILISLAFSQVYAQGLLNDVAAVRFTEPSTPKADTGRFSDAVYQMIGETGKIGILLKNKGTMHTMDNKTRVSIYLENADGVFKDLVFDTTIKVDIKSGDSTEIKIPMFSQVKSFESN